MLDGTAPYRKKERKIEIRLEQRPWITRGILVSMGKRDSLFKSMSQEKDPLLRSETSTTYKRYRNLIITLLKQSKKIYFPLYSGALRHSTLFQ